MATSDKSISSPGDVAKLLLNRPKRWLLPAVVVSLLTGGYALWRPATWEASQTLIVRNEAANNDVGPGKFGHSDQMRAVQETIMELARGRDVLTAALVKVGPPADCENPADWPSDRAVASLRGAVRLTPPGGAEFGMTEVFYLNIKDNDRSRALALTGVICDQLEARFQELRDTKAKSMIDELTKTVKLTRTDLEESTAALSKIETEVGSDLAELRVLHDASSGDSALRRTMSEIRSEKRAIQAAYETNQELHGVLKSAGDDPGRLVATPNRLFQSQPALRRLKDGLVDAQLRTAQLKGRMSDAHPLVRAAKDAEEEIGRHLHAELNIAVRGLQIDLRLGTDRLASLDKQLADVKKRLGRLAELRAEYSNQVAQNRGRTELLKRAEENLAEARSTQASAKAASLIARIGTPDAGVDPLGPSRSMIVLLGMVGGLMTGLGVVFMTYDSTTPARATPTPVESPNDDNLLPLRLPAVSLSLKQALRRVACGQVALS